jgi:hypothetical protein
MSPSHQQKDNMNQINTDKECIRIYSRSNEVFLQSDDNGYIQYFASRQVDRKAAGIAYSVRVPAREVRELLRVAVARGAK